MTESELISLFGYYTGIIAFLFALFTSKIEDWKHGVQKLVNEWDQGEQKNNAIFKVQQKGQLKTLRESKPYFALWAPIGVAIILLALGGFALATSAATVDKCWALALLVFPAGSLLVLHFWHGLHIFGTHSELLERLK